jgi:hypothetical protein
MAVQSKSKQRGITFLGLVFVGGVIAVTGVVAAQVFPTYVEFQSISKAANKAATGSSIPEIRKIFDAAAAIDNINSIKGGDLEITKEGDKVVVSFAYQAEIHLAGPGWLTIKYAGRSK